MGEKRNEKRDSYQEVQTGSSFYLVKYPGARVVTTSERSHKRARGIGKKCSRRKKVQRGRLPVMVATGGSPKGRGKVESVGEGGGRGAPECGAETLKKKMGML